MCGGHTVEVPDAKPASKFSAAAPAAEPIDDSLPLAQAAVASAAVAPPKPSLPGLEFDEDDGAADGSGTQHDSLKIEGFEVSNDTLGGISKGSGDKVDIAPQADEAAAATFERFDAPQEIKPTASSDDGMFEKRDGDSVMPTKDDPFAQKLTDLSSVKAFPGAESD